LFIDFGNHGCFLLIPDKYRENFLGHSIKAPVGRWQKGKDLLWYTKQGKGGASTEGKEQTLRDSSKGNAPCLFMIWGCGCLDE